MEANRRYTIEIKISNGDVIKERVGNNQRAKISKQIKNKDEYIEFINIWPRDYFYIFRKDILSIKIKAE